MKCIKQKCTKWQTNRFGAFDEKKKDYCSEGAKDKFDNCILESKKNHYYNEVLRLDRLIREVNSCAKNK